MTYQKIELTEEEIKIDRIIADLYNLIAKELIAKDLKIINYDYYRKIKRQILLLERQLCKSIKTT